LPDRIYHLQSLRAITEAMRYTNKKPPQDFLDKFHEVRELLNGFNDHYKTAYIPSWLNCLDESMNSWGNKNAPGFMCVPRKPHPFGNEYHSIADGDDGKPIMWRIRLQEGKDRPKHANGKWAFPTQFESHSKTAELMLFMTEPIHHTGKVVCMDSGFCVTAGILALHQVGVYGQALIKKRGRYWPKHVPGVQMEMEFFDKELGSGKTFVQTIENQKFLVHCHKDDRYVCKIMSTHGLMLPVDDHITHRYVNGEWKSFKYCEPMSRHNRSKHWVDDVNNRRHDPIGLEDVWATKWWPHRQFTFVCSVAEVNALNAKARGRNVPAEAGLTFRRKLAEQMLKNEINDSGRVSHSPIRSCRKRKRSELVEHKLEKKPVYTGKYDASSKSWRKVKTKYLKIKCYYCPKEVRTYCPCNKQIILCGDCFGKHTVMVESTV